MTCNSIKAPSCYGPYDGRKGEQGLYFHYDTIHLTLGLTGWWSVSLFWPPHIKYGGDSQLDVILLYSCWHRDETRRRWVRNLDIRAIEVIVIHHICRPIPMQHLKLLILLHHVHHTIATNVHSALLADDGRDAHRCILARVVLAWPVRNVVRFAEYIAWRDRGARQTCVLLWCRYFRFSWFQFFHLLSCAGRIDRRETAHTPNFHQFFVSFRDNFSNRVAIVFRFVVDDLPTRWNCLREFIKW